MLLLFANIQDKLTDTRSPFDKRCALLLMIPIIPCGTTDVFNTISTKDKSRLHQFGTKMLPGICIGFTLNSGGGRTGDMIVADWHDIENYDAPGVHVQYSSPKEVVSSNCRMFFLAQMFL